MMRSCLVALVFAAVLTLSAARTVSLIPQGNDRFSVVEGRVEGAVAWAIYNQTVNSTGWAFLELHTNSECANCTDRLQAFGAGYLEGYLTAPLIHDTYLNVVKDACEGMGTDMCGRIMEFVGENLEWMAGMIDLNPEDPYWYQVKLVLEQLEGLAAGYQNTSAPFVITAVDFLLANIRYDFDALSSALSSHANRTTRQPGTGSCSALIKILHDNSDVLFAHDTWFEYKTMLRIYKLYDFQFTTIGISSSVIPGSQVAFSSYPMSVFSGDDFYTINSGLAVMETTNGNYNADLWQHVSANSTVLNMFRCVVANRLAMTGEAWASIYILHNSGTYNNQWMIFDYNRFEQGRSPDVGAFFLLEQLPGIYEMKDMTSTLVKNGYWASYNIPYFKKIYREGGFPAYEKKYGDSFSWSLAPRAKIFARNHSDVHDMKSMLELMRYNDFKHDPLSNCSCVPPYSAENSIAARSDLNPANGQYPAPFLGHRMHGATDTKITSSSMVRQLSAVVQSGPTFSQQPAFSWSTSGETKPLGHPDIWKFEALVAQWQQP